MPPVPVPKLKDGQLSEKQRRFVNFYMGDAAGNASKAAELAGYSPKRRELLAPKTYVNLKSRPP